MAMAESLICSSALVTRRLRYINLIPSTSSADPIGDACFGRSGRRSGSLESTRQTPVTDPVQCISRGRCVSRSFSDPQRARLRELQGPRRRSKLQAYASQPQPHIAVSAAPGPAIPLRVQTGPGWTLLVLVCATITALAGAFTVFMLYMRPVLRRMEKAALATETASKAMERSAKEFEQTNLMFQADTPGMIAEIEATAQEYRELGHTLNLMTAGFRGKNPVKDWSELGMKRVVKDVSALTNALSPAMDQWRKRISKIATSFEQSHKVEAGVSGKQLKPLNTAAQKLSSKASKAQSTGSVATSKDAQSAISQAAAVQTQPAEGVDAAATNPLAGGQALDNVATEATLDRTAQRERSAGSLQHVEEIGKNLANAAVSLRPREACNKTSALGNKQASKDSIAEETAGVSAIPSTQQALDMLEVDHAQAGAAEINEAAQAAERVTSDVNQLVADLAKESHDGDAVENAFEQSAASQDLPDMSAEEQALLAQLRSKKQAAESVFKALQRAEDAATAAATASGALEQAMQAAESQGVLSSHNDLQSGQSAQKSTDGSKGSKAEGSSKRRQASSAQGQ